jgi:hypothetical protein
MELRELLVILLVALGGSLFVWLETGRDRGILTVTGIGLGAFAVVGALAVVLS